nr:immunoglobulin heavy chain junction region [Macaca mulatta]
CARRGGITRMITVRYNGGEFFEIW